MSDQNYKSFYKTAQNFDQTLIEKARLDQQHMIQQYFNEIARTKQQTEETRRLLFEKQRNIRMLEELLIQKRNILANKHEEQRVMLQHLE